MAVASEQEQLCCKCLVGPVDVNPGFNLSLCKSCLHGKRNFADPDVRTATGVYNLPGYIKPITLATTFGIDMDRRLTRRQVIALYRQRSDSAQSAMTAKQTAEITKLMEEVKILTNERDEAKKAFAKEKIQSDNKRNTAMERQRRKHILEMEAERKKHIAELASTRQVLDTLLKKQKEMTAQLLLAQEIAVIDVENVKRQSALELEAERHRHASKLALVRSQQDRKREREVQPNPFIDVINDLIKKRKI